MRGKAADKPAPKPKGGAARTITDDDLKALAIQNRPFYEAALDKKKKADKALKDVGKTIKADLGDQGLAIIKAMIELDTPEGEARVKAKLRAQATALAWTSNQLGTQILMDLDTPDRTPAADRAYDEGKTASMANKPRKPSYAPETEQYRRYMAGYDADQTVRASKLGRGNDDGDKDLRPRNLQERARERAAEAGAKTPETVN